MFIDYISVSFFLSLDTFETNGTLANFEINPFCYYLEYVTCVDMQVHFKHDAMQRKMVNNMK